MLFLYGHSKSCLNLNKLAVPIFLIWIINSPNAEDEGVGEDGTVGGAKASQSCKLTVKAKQAAALASL